MTQIHRDALAQELSALLNPELFSDYGPNGLQIEGCEHIRKVVFAVSATKASIAYAVKEKANALIVHHGLFWKFHGPKTLTGPFAQRVIPLVRSEINLFGYHLPLDAHMDCGNAAYVAKKLQLRDCEPFGEYKKAPLGVKGRLPQPASAGEVSKILEEALNHSIIAASPEDGEPISSIGIITGGASGEWIQAHKDRLDAYITGEIREHDWHDSQEAGIHMFAAGHNATEVGGVLQLKDWLEEQFSLECLFFASANPA